MPKRHRTMTSTLDWSHGLLDEGTKRTFRRLSVFSGGWTVTGAEAVTAEPAQGATSGLRGHLSTLVEWSLVGFDGERYRFLEPVRQYAAVWLVARGRRGGDARRPSRVPPTCAWPGAEDG